MSRKKPPQRPTKPPTSLHFKEAGKTMQELLSTTESSEEEVASEMASKETEGELKQIEESGRNTVSKDLSELITDGNSALENNLSRKIDVACGELKEQLTSLKKQVKGVDKKLSAEFSRVENDCNKKFDAMLVITKRYDLLMEDLEATLNEMAEKTQNLKEAQKSVEIGKND